VGKNMFSGGKNIFLVSEDEAKEFIEKHGKTDVYEQYFEVEEG